MPLSPLLDNAVAISANYIVLGNAVANFFLKRNIKHITHILDYKNNSLILWGDDPKKTQPGASYLKGTLGHVLYGKGTYVSKQSKTPRAYTIIPIKLKGYVKIKNTAYLAKPLNNSAVIIENVIMEDCCEMKQCCFSAKNEFILFGNYDIGRNITREDLIRKKSQKNPENLVKPEVKPVTSTTLSTVQVLNTQIIEDDAQKQADDEYKSMILGE